MGQYYRPIIVVEGKAHKVNPLKFYEGQKLMEHAYFGNSVVTTICSYLMKYASKNPRLAWIGDYSDGVEIKGKKFVYDDGQEIKSPIRAGIDIPRFCIDVTQKEYVDLDEYAKLTDNWGDAIHPLPLLTACGNGAGGGDYFGTDMDYVGRWAGDVIKLTNNVKSLKGYTKIEPKFEEKY